MKKITLAILSCAALSLCGTDVFAQGKWGADSAECIKYMSYYKEYYKQKAYDEAIPNWRKAYSLCPATASQNMLLDGASLLRRLIAKNESDAKYKDALVDSLLTLHDVRAKYYPKYAVTALNNKGLDMSKYLTNDQQKLYDGYEGIIANNKEQTKVSIFLFDLQAAIELFQAGSLDTETIINLYQRNNDYIDKAPVRNDIEREQNENVKTDMGNLFAASKVASCDHLITIYGPRFDADPENLDLASSIVKTMSMAEDCSDNDLFLRAVTTMNKLKPSANSAYYLFKLHSAKGNTDEAITYMEEAIASEESDANTDLEWKYELATFCYKSGLNAKAVEYANQVAENSPELAGKAYFLIATVWASTRCGGDEISSRAPFWVACDYMNKAKNADPSLAESATEHIRQYSSYFPQAAEAFMYDITNGQSYTVVCGGMRATTTVRTTK